MDTMIVVERRGTEGDGTPELHVLWSGVLIGFGSADELEAVAKGIMRGWPADATAGRRFAADALVFDCGLGVILYDPQIEEFHGSPSVGVTFSDRDEVARVIHAAVEVERERAAQDGADA